MAGGLLVTSVWLSSYLAMPFLLSLFEKGPCRQVAATTEFLIPLGPVMRVRRHDRVQSRRILIAVLEANSATATWWS